MTGWIGNSLTWKCPRCGTRHYWTWDYGDIPSVGDVFHMECEHCGYSSKMKCKMVKA